MEPLPKYHVRGRFINQPGCNPQKQQKPTGEIKKSIGNWPELANAMAMAMATAMAMWPWPRLWLWPWLWL